MYPQYSQFQQPIGYNNPMAMTQQRLNMMEQQYPQFQQNPPQQMSSALKGRPVSSIEEARASMIDLDGSVHYFIDKANSCIYTKQINLDGTATLDVYTKQIEQIPQVSSLDTVEPIKREEFNSAIQNLQQQISNIAGELGIKGGILDDKSDAANANYAKS